MRHPTLDYIRIKKKIRQLKNILKDSKAYKLTKISRDKKFFLVKYTYFCVDNNKFIAQQISTRLKDNSEKKIILST